MRKSNLTYKKLIELAPKDRPFQIKIQYFNKKIYTSWAILSPVFELDFKKEKTSIRYELFVQDYKKRIELITEYDFLETLTLIDEYRNMYEKPEELKVRTEEGIPGFEDTINQLDNLFTQGQDVINKYKK